MLLTCPFCARKRASAVRLTLPKFDLGGTYFDTYFGGASSGGAGSESG